MTQERFEEEKAVWLIVAQLIQFHSAAHPDYKSISPDDKLEKYFPIAREDAFNRESEDANRWAAVLWDAIENVNRVFGKNLKYDFLVRGEWDFFETVGDYWLYMVSLFKGRAK